MRGARCGMGGAQGTLPLPAHPAHFPCSLSGFQCPHLTSPSLSTSSPGPSVRNFFRLTGMRLGAFLAERSLHQCLNL